MKAKFQDSKTIYKLITAHRVKPRVQLEELIVGDNTYSSPENIIMGWKKQFESLATPADRETANYTDKDFDIDVIFDLCKNDDQELVFSTEEF